VGREEVRVARPSAARRPRPRSDRPRSRRSVPVRFVVLPRRNEPFSGCGASWRGYP
jgi:hypothetical protein